MYREVFFSLITVFGKTVLLLNRLLTISLFLLVLLFCCSVYYVIILLVFDTFNMKMFKLHKTLERESKTTNQTIKEVGGKTQKWEKMSFLL
jgi:Ca2+/Na+ antiporter